MERDRDQKETAGGGETVGFSLKGRKHSPPRGADDICVSCEREKIRMFVC